MIAKKQLLLSLAALAVFCSPHSGAAQVFEVLQVSRASDGSPANGASGDLAGPVFSVSSDGSRVAFSTLATNLANTGGSSSPQVLLADLASGTPSFSLLSSDASGAAGNSASGAGRAGASNVAITRSGIFTVFTSLAINFGVSGSNLGQIFRVNSSLAQTDPSRLALVSTLNGSFPNGQSFYPSIDDSGNIVPFVSEAALNGQDQNSSSDAYVRIMSTGQVNLFSIHDGRIDGGLAGGATQAVVSGNAAHIAFVSSTGSYFIGGNGAPDVKTTPFNDVLLKTFDPDEFFNGYFIFRAAFSLIGTPGHANGDSDTPALSQDGLTVAYRSDASNLVNGDSNGASDVFVASFTFSPSNGFNRTSLVRASVDRNGRQVSGGSGLGGLSISDDGRLVAFASDAQGLVPGVSSSVSQIYVKDMQSGGIKLVSTSLDGTPGNGPSFHPRISGDGNYVVFASLANNLLSSPIEGGTGTSDIFRVRFSTPIALTPGVAPAAPPPAAVSVTNDQAKVTLAEFVVGKKKPKARISVPIALAARAKAKPVKRTISYQITLVNQTAGTQRKATTKRNTFTFKKLPPGTYLVTYRAALMQGKKTLVRTPFAQAQPFTIGG